MAFPGSVRTTAIPLALACAVAACGDDAVSRDRAAAVAELRDAEGRAVGEVRFRDDDRGTRVTHVAVEIDGLSAEPGFHGLHVHVNDDPSNGEGCSARADEPPGSWFASADGHLGRPDEQHGHHQGDMPSVLVARGGTATAEFVTDRFSVDDLEGTAVILHAGPDNFGNVPTGSDDESYTPNAPAAVTATERTGNAGDRIACGVVEPA